MYNKCVNEDPKERGLEFKTRINYYLLLPVLPYCFVIVLNSNSLFIEPFNNTFVVHFSFLFYSCNIRDASAYLHFLAEESSSCSKCNVLKFLSQCQHIVSNL